MHDGKAGGYSETADACALCLVHARTKVWCHSVAFFFKNIYITRVEHRLMVIILSWVYSTLLRLGKYFFFLGQGWGAGRELNPGLSYSSPAH
jgi:hypothetical protein